MSDNENMKPLFDEEKNTAEEVKSNVPPIPGSFFTEYTVPAQTSGEKAGFTEAESFEDAEPEELTDEVAELTDDSAFSENFAEPPADAEELPETYADISEVDFPKEEEFNPYAPKMQKEQTFNDYTAPVNNANRYTGGVNPSYNRPVYNNNPYENQKSPDNYPPAGYYGKAPEGRGSKGRKLAVGVVAVCVAVAVIALISSLLGKTDVSVGDTTTTASAGYQEQTTAQTTAQNVTVATTQASNQMVNSVWVAEKVRPSVVGVMAYRQGELAGEGSGVLMSEDAGKNCTYIVTCAHVIDEPGCEFGVLLLDGSRYDATVVAIDVRTDIGVLKVEKTGLPLAEFGDSSSLKIGEPIYAIGNPGGSEYFGSITNGIIAAIDRSISATYTMTCIQHNAAINPGNSGGALVNSAGQVIGINSSKIAKTDFEGMGFAVPSSIFRTVVDDLIQYGYVPNRPELGIKYASVSDYQLYSIIVSIKGLPRGSVIIAEIPEGSALSGTDAQVGDLIIAVNGKKMDTSDVLLDLVDTGAVGDTLTLTLCRINDRSYETSTFDVTVQLVENKGSVTTTTKAQTLPQQDPYGDLEDFFGGFFGW